LTAPPSTHLTNLDLIAASPSSSFSRFRQTPRPPEVLIASCWILPYRPHRVCRQLAILTKSGISTVATSGITGNIGVSPIAAAAITGFGLTPWNRLDSTSTQIMGTDDQPSRPTRPTRRTTMGQHDRRLHLRLERHHRRYHLLQGTGKNEGETDVFIIQIPGTCSGTTVLLDCGALAENIFWQVASQVTVMANAHMEGILLVKTAVTFEADSSLEGRPFTQTRCNLDHATIN
jgi:hypothetical protein